MSNPSALLFISILGLLLAGSAAAMLQTSRSPITATPALWVGLIVGLASLSAATVAEQNDSNQYGVVDPPKCELPHCKVWRELKKNFSKST